MLLFLSSDGRSLHTVGADERKLRWSKRDVREHGTTVHDTYQDGLITSPHTTSNRARRLPRADPGLALTKMCNFNTWDPLKLSRKEQWSQSTADAEKRRRTVVWKKTIRHINERT